MWSRGGSSGFIRNDIAMMKLDTPHDCVDVRVADASDDALTTAGNLRKPNMQACVVRLCALERVHGWVPIMGATRAAPPRWHQLEGYAS